MQHSPPPCTGWRGALWFGMVYHMSKAQSGPRDTVSAHIRSSLIPLIVALIAGIPLTFLLWAADSYVNSHGGAGGDGFSGLTLILNVGAAIAAVVAVINGKTVAAHIAVVASAIFVSLMTIHPARHYLHIVGIVLVGGAAAHVYYQLRRSQQTTPTATSTPANTLITVVSPGPWPPPAQAATPAPHPSPPARLQRSRVLAIVLAVLLGPFGVHRFYLGMYTSGLVMAAASLLPIPLAWYAPEPIGWLLLRFPLWIVPAVVLIDAVRIATRNLPT
jgi:TM2 domain-containing membrane protein YozV